MDDKGESMCCSDGWEEII
jgi:hypothetical protein